MNGCLKLGTREGGVNDRIWVYRPELSVVSENDPFLRTDDVSVLGHE